VNVIPSAIRLLDPVGPIPAPQVKATPAVPKSDASAERPIKPGGDLQAGKLVRKVTPSYPQMAAVARVEGVVRFAAVIGKDGTIRNLRVLNGPQLLVQAATDAVKQWVYQPTLLNGEPVEVQTQIQVAFNLNK
jgi:protein TonB